jgi:ribonuclease HII
MIDLGLFKKKFKTPKNTDRYTNFFIAGCDEVGRGPLAGPVVAACASLHFKVYQEEEVKLLFNEWEIFGVNDSKKLTSSKRQAIISDLPFLNPAMKVDQIYTHSYSENMSLNILIQEISPQQIDEINILNASLKALKGATEKSCNFERDGLVMIDGNKIFKSDSKTVELLAVVKGDSKSFLIAMASIVAKEYRDQLMADYSQKYPGYFWEENAGYGTKKHLQAIGHLGITEIHRKSFKGVKEVYDEGSNR